MQLSSAVSDNTYEQHHPLIGSFIHPLQHINNSASSGPISIGTAISNINQSQPSVINISKVLGSMGSNIDRSVLRQQPPPMKVSFEFQIK